MSKSQYDSEIRSNDGDVAIFEYEPHNQHFGNTTKVNIPKALRARSLEPFEGNRVTVEVYCESGYNVYFIDGNIVKVTKPEDLPAGCKFEYYVGFTGRDYHHKAFYMVRRFVGRYVKNLLRLGVDVGEYEPGDDSYEFLGLKYLGYKDFVCYEVKLYDGLYSEDELAMAKLDKGYCSCPINVIEEGSEVVDGVKYNYRIYSYRNQ